MLISDILNSCVQRDVAQAAVVSIGGDFARRIQLHAGAQNKSIGEYTAHHVSLFTRRATERDWRDLAARMRGEDLALLSGLQIVMTRMMTKAVDSDDAVSVSPLAAALKLVEGQSLAT